MEPGKKVKLIASIGVTNSVDLVVLLSHHFMRYLDRVDFFLSVFISFFCYVTASHGERRNKMAAVCRLQLLSIRFVITHSAHEKCVCTQLILCV